MHHTWHFSGPRIVDFYRPGIQAPWLLFNREPERAWQWAQCAHDEIAAYGSPIYEHGYANLTQRYIPDPTLEEKLTSVVSDAGGAAFFEDPKWRATLTSICRVLWE